MSRYSAGMVACRTRFVIVVLLAGCTESLPSADSGVVACATTDECPAGLTCAAAGVCVANDTACVEAGQAVQDGNRCPLPDDLPGVCVRGVCTLSRCGDAVVDERIGEGCDCGDAERGAIERCDGTSNTVVLNGNGPDQCRTDCSRPRCGDAVVDSAEVCDDGNLVSGDGVCSGDCQSEEVCGNGYLDAAMGEVCDDGNVRSGDGCTGQCRVVEVPNWDVEPSFLTTGRETLAFAYDSDREVIVGFGGTDGSLFGDTFELSADTSGGGDPVWRLAVVAPVQSPPARRLARMVYDRSRRRMVLFGGRESFDAALRNDTWEYDGSTWVQINDGSVDAPSVRTAPAMAYDPIGERVVLFGGDLPDATFAGDTWVYDASGWRELTVTTPPSPRGLAALAFDPARGVLTLFGGVTRAPGTTRFDETWTLDGAVWTQQSPVERPPARTRHAAAMRPGNDGILVFGGVGSGELQDTWAYNGTTWSELASAVAPSPRFFFGMARFDALDGAVLFGGTDNAGEFFDDLWFHDGSQWAPIALEPSDPEGRRSHSLAYDEVRRRVVLVGGSLGVRLDDTWEFDGARWIARTDVGFPLSSALAGRGIESASMVFDRRRGVMVLFSGRRGDVSIPSTWEYDGASWAEVFTSAMPAARFAHAMAYDSQRERVVLFGGCPEFLQGQTCAIGEALNDTWIYDGEWQVLTSATTPPARYGHALAYDELRDRVVLFGGENVLETFGDTWEFDGSNWVAVVHDEPEPRFGHKLVYDPVASRVLLFGGFERVDGDFADTWFYGESGWEQVFPAFAPAPRRNFGMAYERERRGVFLFGGQPRDPGLAYLFRLTSAQAPEICDSGFDEDGDESVDCDDPDCNLSAACATIEECSNGVDDDEDGRVDCADPNCGGSSCSDSGAVCIGGACLAPG